MKPILAILLGDPAGIGAELVAKTAADGFLTEHCRPILIGSHRVFSDTLSRLSLSLPFQVIRSCDAPPEDGCILLWDIPFSGENCVAYGTISGVYGKQVTDQIDLAMTLWEEKKIGAVCFGPFTKASLKAYLGDDIHSEMDYFLQKLHYNGPHNEINQLDHFYTTRATSHIPVSQISSALNEDTVLTAIRLLWDTIVSTGNTAPRIAVAALNPHGGENGTCGREELDLILPTIKKAAAQGMPVLGPFPADTVFYRAAVKKEFDGVVTMYHDQGQIALKLLGFERGVTIQGGLPCPITTPAHGSALDIAGKGLADPSAFKQALLIAVSMAK